MLQKMSRVATDFQSNQIFPFQYNANIVTSRKERQKVQLNKDQGIHVGQVIPGHLLSSSLCQPPFSRK